MKPSPKPPAPKNDGMAAVRCGERPVSSNETPIPTARENRGRSKGGGAAGDGGAAATVGGGAGAAGAGGESGASAGGDDCAAGGVSSAGRATAGRDASSSNA